MVIASMEMLEVYHKQHPKSKIIAYLKKILQVSAALRVQ